MKEFSQDRDKKDGRHSGQVHTDLKSVPEQSGESAGSGAVPDVSPVPGKAAEPIPIDRSLIPINARRTAVERCNDGRPVLSAEMGDLDDTLQGVESALVLYNQSELRIFRCAGRLVEVKPGADGIPEIVIISRARMYLFLGHAIRWVKQTKDGVVETRPPFDLSTAVLASDHPLIPELRAVVTFPYFLHDGTLVSKPGYHHDAKVLLVLPDEINLEEDLEIPTAEQIAAARKNITDLFLHDFAMADPASLANTVALILLPIVRRMICGLAPATLVGKPRPGEGATLLVRTIHWLVTGSEPDLIDLPDTKDEQRKLLTSVQRRNPPFIIFDNVNDLRHSSLAMAITSGRRADRLLGSSELLRMPNDTVWVVTGINIRCTKEMARRVVSIRLDSGMSRPQDRVPPDGWKCGSDLVGWVRQYRSDMLVSCLIMVKAWLAAGRPPGDQILGGFESYSHVLGGILNVVGISGFLANKAEFLDMADAESRAWEVLVREWWQEYEGAPVSAKHLLPIVHRHELDIDVGSGNEHQQRIKLGYHLSKHLGDGYGGLKIVADTPSHHSNKVRLVKVVNDGKPT